MHHVGQDASFAKAYNVIKAYFDTDSNHQVYYSDWTLLTFKGVRNLNPGKTLVEAVETLVEKLHLCQRALGKAYEPPEHLVAAVIRAFQDLPKMSDALSDSITNFETLMLKLRARAAVLQREESASQYVTDMDTDLASSHRRRDCEEATALYTDRKFLGCTRRQAWSSQC
jgi:hypothetical protein